MNKIQQKAGVERHVVQCYGADSSRLIANVSQYLITGAQHGDSLLVIATPEHADALVWRPARQDLRLSEALRDGRLMVLDAGHTLDAFLIDHQPDPDLFDIVVGGAVRQLLSRHPGAKVRAYGEMVGVLWKAWKFDAAIRLEEHWNRLLRVPNVSLFCSYPIDVFGLEFDPEILEPVLCAHTHLVQGTDTDLEAAMDRAMHEVLGTAPADINGALALDARWARVSPGEAKVLWLRANHPNRAQDVLRQARSYYQASTAA